jgi:triacylglycerol esterase/lipase EstA (alpha/beta hydrolase family)
MEDTESGLIARMGWPFQWAMSAAKSASVEAWCLGVHMMRYGSGVLDADPCRMEPPDGVAPLDEPVLLVHGLFQNRSAFDELARSLRLRGFRWVWPINCDPLGGELSSMAQVVGARVKRALELTSAERVHLVGHSLGGLVVRWYVQEQSGHGVTGRCITIATPHEGTRLAYAGPGPVARLLRPDSPEIAQLAVSLPSVRTRFVNYYSSEDPVIAPASAARLPAVEGCVNYQVPIAGHNILLFSRRVHASIAAELRGAVSPDTPRALLRRAA